MNLAVANYHPSFTVKMRSRNDISPFWLSTESCWSWIHAPSALNPNPVLS